MRAPDGIAVCAWCENEFVFWLPVGGQPDVFSKIMQEVGKTVCPDCIRAASQPPSED